MVKLGYPIKKKDFHSTTGQNDPPAVSFLILFSGLYKKGPGIEFCTFAMPRTAPSRATQVKSSRTIKRFWRNHKHLDTRALVKAFHELGPTAQRVRSMRYVAFFVVCFVEPEA